MDIDIVSLAIIKAAGFIIPPYINRVIKNPNIHIGTVVFGSASFLYINPDMKPIRPQANICHGVQGPCPKNMLDTKAVITPIRKPR